MKLRKHSARHSFVALVVVALVQLAAQAKADDRQELDVFKANEGGYRAYRIPSLIVTTKGTLLVFCEARKTSLSDDGDIDLVMRRSTDGGKTWGPMQLVLEEGGAAEIKIGNPCPVVDQSSGTILLGVNRSILGTAPKVFILTSTDDGQTWSQPKNITEQSTEPGWGLQALGPGVGIQLGHGSRQGRLVLPANHRPSLNKRDPSASHVIYSDDGGKSWQRGGTVGLHTNECQVVEVPAASGSGVLIDMRNHFARSGNKPDLAGKRIMSRSTDGGLTWSPVEFSAALIEPTCQASIIRYSWPQDATKSRLLFSNPASSKRENMTVRLSYDEGQTWPLSKVIYPGPAAYSCLAALADGTIGLIDERDGYGKLTFTSFSLAWLTDGKDDGKK